MKPRKKAAAQRIKAVKPDASSMKRTLAVLSRILATTSGEKEFDLGGGYFVRLVAHPLAHDNDSWDFIQKLSFSENKLGFITVYMYETGPALAHITLNSAARQKGLGRKAVTKLVDHYGSLTSDPQGNTSNDAARMWEALHAEKIPTDKNTKGWMYILRKK